jgi:hypothetical protein
VRCSSFIYYKTLAAVQAQVLLYNNNNNNNDDDDDDDNDDDDDDDNNKYSRHALRAARLLVAVLIRLDALALRACSAVASRECAPECAQESHLAASL